MIEAPAKRPVEWETPPPHLRIDPQEVHVWRGGLDRSPSDLQAFWDVLNPVERNRAQRFYSSQHQDRFIAAHGMVRHILALYLNLSPATLRFDNATHGKPLLAPPTHKRLFFNLSHSQNLALLAVTRLGEIGVDLEQNRPTLNYTSLAERIMSEEERSIFGNLPSNRQRSAFFSCWTRKEAVIKAHGRGLGFPLNELSVSLAPLPVPHKVTIQGDSTDGDEWWIYEIFPGNEYTAALAVKGKPTGLRFLHFSDEHFSPPSPNI